MIFFCCLFRPEPPSPGQTNGMNTPEQLTGRFQVRTATSQQHKLVHSLSWLLTRSAFFISFSFIWSDLQSVVFTAICRPCSSCVDILAAVHYDSQAFQFLFGKDAPIKLRFSSSDTNAIMCFVGSSNSESRWESKLQRVHHLQPGVAVPWAVFPRSSCQPGQKDADTHYQ